MASDETRARIIEAAGPVFAERGFRDATIREICDAAGVGLASVNYHFRDKQHLYVRVVEEAFDEMLRAKPPLTDWPPGTSPQTRLREWIERLVGHALATHRDSWQDRLLTREIREPTPDCDKILHKRIDRELAPLDAILMDVLSAETTRTERRRLAVSIVGQILIYDTHRDLVRWLIDDEDAGSTSFDITTVARHAERVVLAILGLGPPLEPRRDATDQNVTHKD
jgi:AcrR family transcriptional regulator